MPKKQLNDYEQGLYEASYRDIVVKNFVAGLTRGIGMAVAQLFFLVILAALFVNFVQPIIGPLFDTLDIATQELQRLPGSNSQFFTNPTTTP